VDNFFYPLKSPTDLTVSEGGSEKADPEARKDRGGKVIHKLSTGYPHSKRRSKRLNRTQDRLKKR